MVPAQYLCLRCPYDLKTSREGKFTRCIIALHFFHVDMEEESSREGLSKDRGSILLLLLLYVLQGIPLGLAGSIPMILQNRHVTYKEQV